MINALHRRLFSKKKLAILILCIGAVILLGRYLLVIRQWRVMEDGYFMPFLKAYVSTAQRTCFRAKGSYATMMETMCSDDIPPFILAEAYRRRYTVALIERDQELEIYVCSGISTACSLGRLRNGQAIEGARTQPSYVPARLIPITSCNKKLRWW